MLKQKRARDDFDERSSRSRLKIRKSCSISHRRQVAQLRISTAPSPRRYYVLAILTVVYALNFLDRTIFNVLIEPIKKEFALSDTAMGLLAGFGFALFPLLVSPIGLTGAT